MAGTSLLALLDDIATILDDIATMTKVAAKKTAGVLGDDLALNAEQVTGVKADRELPVVWAVAKGSFINKLILVPAALGISAVLPWLITPLLMLGGAYLCFEGFEKIAHKFLHPQEEKEEKAELVQSVKDPNVDLLAFEKRKIKGAIRTDFILSAEIIVIALGTVQNQAFLNQVFVVSTIAVVMTIGVYSLVGGIVKLDDAGLLLLQAKGEEFFARSKRKLGRGILKFAPFLMKSLSVIGTIAMFLVGGGILVHGVPGSHHIIDNILGLTEGEVIDGIVHVLLPPLINCVAGIVSGAVVLGLVGGVKKLLPATAMEK